MAFAHAFTDRRHGDVGDVDAWLATAGSGLAPPPGPPTWLSQVHGAEVVVVTEPGEHAGAAADAAVTVVPGAPLVVRTADCAPILLEGRVGIGVVHAGWRGLEAGVVEAAADALSGLGGEPDTVRLGPCIRPRCYEFGEVELDRVAARCGDTVRATTAWGTPALDLAAGVAEAARRLGLRFDDDGTCTACSPRHWSFRARADRGRQALVAWVVPS
ncbi:MAG: polyphenol oxidase family protein [Acidimicrobiales bacterium]|nr:polyphenol oxidase family protein [Acidimicrobiales bacterium]HRW36605.1 laccase domain-containing protein [Aquihabitans sp.]